MSYESPDVVTVITLPCMVCGKTSAIPLPREQIERWQGGEHIQNVWPHWTPDDREMLMTGTHSKCWKIAFPPEEKE